MLALFQESIDSLPTTAPDLILPWAVAGCGLTAASAWLVSRSLPSPVATGNLPRADELAHRGLLLTETAPLNPQAELSRLGLLSLAGEGVRTARLI